MSLNSLSEFLSPLYITVGFVKEDYGRIIIGSDKDAINLTPLPPYERSKYVGRIFQYPKENLIFDLTILENIVLSYQKLFNKKYFFPKIFLRGKIKEVIQTLKLGLEDRLDEPVGNLSGGQKQALAVLTTILQEPKILLLDEHTAALDIEMKKIIGDLTFDLIEKNKITSIITSHNFKEAFMYGDRICVLHKGKIIKDITREEKKYWSIHYINSIFNKIYEDEYMHYSESK